MSSKLAKRGSKSGSAINDFHVKNARPSSHGLANTSHAKVAERCPGYSHSQPEQASDARGRLRPPASGIRKQRVASCIDPNIHASNCSFLTSDGIPITPDRRD
jgi:hypothetical protein